jgi:hypothetical protein
LPRKPGRGTRSRPIPAPAAPPALPIDATERELLALARDVTALGTLDGALARLVPVPPSSGPTGDVARAATKQRALALAWAREQARLALREVVERAAIAGAARRDVDADTLAWLLLAAGEALAREPAEAVPDRVRALAAFVRGGDAPR